MKNSETCIDVVFWEAAQIAPGAERDAYLAQACGEDSDLQKRVAKLLQAQAKAESFLEHPFAGPASTGEFPTAGETLGTMIGPYKLLEQIGEGGFGLVYMAEQQEPVRRKVALKILKPGMDTRQVIARFEAERQAVALMDHPNIARVFDAGASASGRPYFVMELVRGIPITRHCDDKQLTTRERLELFISVCQAVQHAHQKGIIHRDLKPSNVLVSPHDGVPVVKIIDFGIAKALGQQLTDKTLFTGFAQLIGTPLYMAPEQAELNAVDIDTRTDVYSLGVLLYELLTGTTPFDQERLKTASFDEIRRIIREEEPVKPSTRVSTLAMATTTVVQRGKTNPRQLCQLFRGDLDWIVMKALEKDRDRRYESASALAADVQRYLSDEPVQACPPSASYRLQKYARRNRWFLLPASVVASVLIVATAVSTSQAIKARQAERRAETEAAIARAVKDFLQGDLLEQAASSLEPGEEFVGDPYLTVRDALRRAGSRIGERFRDQPLIEAAIRTTIGAAYNHLHEYGLAVPHLERAVALHQALLGPDHADTLSSVDELATAFGWVGRRSEAIALCKEALARRKTRLGPDHPETLSWTGKLARVYRLDGQFDTSLQLLEALLAKRSSLCGSTDAETLHTMHELAMNYLNMSRVSDSIALHEVLVERHTSTASSDSIDLTWRMLTFAQACQSAGQFDRAERLLRETLQNEPERGDSATLRAHRATALGGLGRNLLLQKKCADAEPLLREAVAYFEKNEPDMPRRFYWLSLLGAVLAGQQKYAEAEPLLRQGYEGLKQREATLLADDKQRRLPEAGERLVRFFEDSGEPEKARAWREKVKRNTIGCKFGCPPIIRE